MLFYAMLYCSAVMQLCFFSYDSVVLFYYVGLQNYSVVLCLVMLVYHFLILFCTGMFSVHTMPLWYLQLNIFIPTPVSHHIYLRSQPTQSTPLFGTPQMTQNISFIHDTRSTEISTFSQCTKLQVVTHLPVYTPDTIHVCL